MKGLALISDGQSTDTDTGQSSDNVVEPEELERGNNDRK